MAAEPTSAALDEGSLPAVIGRQCERLSAETGVAVTMRSDDELPALGMATDVVLLRAAQEAFANVRRHVQASTGSVELSSVAGRVRLSVADNGISLVDGHADGFGLGGMGARTTQIGGTMSVTLRGMIDAEHDLTVVGEAGSGAEAIALAESLRPDVILMDLRMPDVDGVLAPTVADRLVHFVRQPISVALSAREVEVLSQVVAKGSTNAEIGRLLHISEATVKNPSAAGVQQAGRVGSHRGGDDGDVVGPAQLETQRA
jgi:CheY-like chemotaxis protein